MSTTVLLSSAGRRIGLWNCFRESLNGKGRVAIIDSSRTAPAAHIAEQARLVPHCKSPQFLPEVLQLCREDAVSVIVPTIDTELPVYAAALERFKSAGTTVCISSIETVLLGVDKTVTHNWLSQSGFPTVRQALPSEVLREKASWPLPLIAKPYNGSASVGVRLVTSWTELELLRSESPDYIVQEKASGREFTINVYVNRQGQCVCAVPHWRMEVRAGEVSKGITVKDPRLVSLARRIAEALPGAYGPLNIQCFMEDSGEPKVIEINPRFGGGYPLAHRAGARFTSWILEELEGHKVSYFDGWQDGLAMLRYDEAVYLPAVALGVNN